MWRAKRPDTLSLDQVQVPAPSATPERILKKKNEFKLMKEYSKSRLRYFYFRIPLSIEWQTRINGNGPLFFAVGPEAEICHGFRSKGKMNGAKQTFDKDLHARPLGINILAQAGYADLGVYALFHLRIIREE